MGGRGSSSAGSPGILNIKGAKKMTRKEVYGFIESMASSQGFYGRLLNRLNEVDEDVSNEFLDSFAGCKDMLDVVMFLEG